MPPNQEIQHERTHEQNNVVRIWKFNSIRNIRKATIPKIRVSELTGLSFASERGKGISGCSRKS